MPAQAFLPELFPMPVSLHALHEETIGLQSEGNSNATSPFCALTSRPERPIRVGPRRRVALAEMALYPCHPKFDGELPLRVISGHAGQTAARQVNPNKRTPELEQTYLAIRHPLAG
jgi:hypothetical protein